MALSTRSLGSFARVGIRASSCRARRKAVVHSIRPFASTRSCWNAEEDDKDLAFLREAYATDRESMPQISDATRDALRNMRETAEGGEEVDLDNYLSDANEFIPPAFRGPAHMLEPAADPEARKFDGPVMKEEQQKSGFFDIDATPDDMGPDPVFAGDDYTALAHGELEQHRELREFARIIAWDMPLLHNHMKKFEPPTAAQPLRFRYTTYLGEEHPAAKKVVVTFAPTAMPGLSPAQAAKMIKILGVRYNPSTETAKMSCELFPTAPQNKRYLGDLVDKLVAEAKDDTDTFADMPFDFRHHTPKKHHAFPEEWKMTEERRVALAQKRVQVEAKELEGKAINGLKLVEDMISGESERPSPIMAELLEGTKTSGRGRQNRRPEQPRW